MSSQQRNGNRQPTADELRRARHAGFINATAHLRPEQQNYLYDKYTRVDARRERNVTNFYKQIGG